MKPETNISRRRIVQSAIVAGAGTMFSPTHSAAAAAAEPNSTDANDVKVILFQGDSITDVGRDRKKQVANQPASLGRGYPYFIAGGLLAEHPQKNLQIYNRGISGNKVPDLQKRWQQDCIDLKPDVLSILIGVNDIWHKLNGRYEGTVQTYDEGFRSLLKETQQKLPDTRIVICEPFVLRCGAVTDRWFPEFEQRRQVARKIAADLQLTLVPFQEMFDQATAGNVPPQYWAGDGVHPTIAGHALMAKTWRETVGI